MRTVVHIITGLNDGGAEGALTRLCGASKEFRHVVISFLDEGKYGPLLRAAGVDVYCLNQRRGRLTPHAFLKLVRLIRREEPHLVQTWMYHADLIGGLAARVAGAQSVIWGIRQTHLVEGIAPHTTILIARLCACLSRILPSLIVCCAEAAAKSHAALGYDSGRMRVIPNGYDFSSLRYDASAVSRLRAEWSVPGDVPLLGTVARFHPFKDHANLLRAVGRLVSAGLELRLVLVGKEMTSDNAALSAHIKDAGLVDKVILLGQRRDIPAIMSAIDLHVLSSATEAFPNVVAEALACGTPGVVTDVGDAAVILGDCGWVVPPQDDHRLAEALAQALSLRKDQVSWTELRARCAKHVRSIYGLNQMVERYEAVWDEATQARNVSPHEP